MRHSIVYLIIQGVSSSVGYLLFGDIVLTIRGKFIIGRGPDHESLSKVNTNWNWSNWIRGKSCWRRGGGSEFSNSECTGSWFGVVWRWFLANGVVGGSGGGFGKGTSWLGFNIGHGRR